MKKHHEDHPEQVIDPDCVVVVRSVITPDMSSDRQALVHVASEAGGALQRRKRGLVSLMNDPG